MELERERERGTIVGGTMNTIAIHSLCNNLIISMITHDELSDRDGVCLWAPGLAGYIPLIRQTFHDFRDQAAGPPFLCAKAAAYCLQTVKRSYRFLPTFHGVDHLRASRSTRASIVNVGDNRPKRPVANFLVHSYNPNCSECGGKLF